MIAQHPGFPPLRVWSNWAKVWGVYRLRGWHNQQIVASHGIDPGFAVATVYKGYPSRGPARLWLALRLDWLGLHNVEGERVESVQEGCRRAEWGLALAIGEARAAGRLLWLDEPLPGAVDRRPRGEQMALLGGGR